MPLIQGIRKSPLDLNNNVKIGVAFPLDETNVFNSTETLMDQAKSNLLNLLLTAPGERVNLPEFGVGLKHLLFEQNIDTGEIEGRITSQLSLYVPEIEVANVMVTEPPNDHKVFITLSYKMILDGTKDSIQLNFNMMN